MKMNFKKIGLAVATAMLVLANFQAVNAQTDNRLKEAIDLSAAKKPEEAIKVYLDIYNDAKLRDSQRAYGALMASQTASSLYDMDRARSFLVEALGKFPSGQEAALDSMLISLHVRLALLEAGSGQNEKAVIDLEKLLAESKIEADSYKLAMALVQIHWGAQDPVNSIKASQKILGYSATYWKTVAHPIRNSASLLRCDLESEKLIRDTLSLLYLCESNSDGPQTLEPIKACIVQLQLLVGEYEEAQYDALVLTEIASTKPALEDAVKLLVAATKAVDGHVARANQYLNYQNARGSVKPGEAAPVNPLRGLKPVNSPERIKIYEAKIQKIQMKDWTSHLEKARAFHAMGKPSDALIELDLAYKACPIDKFSMQRVVDQTADVLIQVSGDPSMGQKLVDYLRFGEAGPDTKKGTDDDLVDPRTPFMIKK